MDAYSSVSPRTSPAISLSFFGGLKPQYLHLYHIVRTDPLDRENYVRIRVTGPWAVGNRLATLAGPRVHRLRVLLRLRVNADIDCRVKAILDLGTDERYLQKWIVATLLSHVE